MIALVGGAEFGVVIADCDGDTSGCNKGPDNQRRQPSKKKSTERIDGIVATIMALGRAMQQPQQLRSVYETRGLIVG